MNISIIFKIFFKYLSLFSIKIIPLYLKALDLEILIIILIEL
jgi:hypothetical protein